MPGPLPKPPGMRQRRNRAATRANLGTEAAAAKNAVPPLPKRARPGEQWHPMVLAWWRAVWRSPMAAEFLESDRLGGLTILAELYEDFWSSGANKRLVTLSGEIRAQEARFGLSPIDRRRLQWEIEKGQQAEERTARRRGLRDAAGQDPRNVLRVVRGDRAKGKRG